MKKDYFRQWERIPHRFGAIREECLDAESIEYLLLSIQHNRALYDQFADHFVSCEHCLRRIRNISTFYSILDHELDQPVSSRIEKMAKILTEPVV